MVDADMLQWHNRGIIAGYTALNTQCTCDDECACVVWLQSAEDTDGRVWYRWRANDYEDRGDAVCGEPTLDIARVRADGERYSREHDEPLDLRETCLVILTTGYFANTTTLNNLCSFCRGAAKYPDGYFIIPKGWRPCVASLVWQLQPQVRRKQHVLICAAYNYPRPELVARSLFQAIKEACSE